MDSKYFETFARNLRYYASLRGKTQSDIARDTGIKQGSISKYFNGERIPRMDRLDALASYLGVTKNALLGNPPTVERVYKGDDMNPELKGLIKVALESTPGAQQMAADFLRRMKAYTDAMQVPEKKKPSAGNTEGIERG